MKILVVSMRSIHAIRWVSQLEDSGHEVHWFDILNGGRIEQLDWVTQHTNWRYKFGDFKGRFFLKKHFPSIHNVFENDVEKKFKHLLKIVQPDVVHSFVLYKCCVPIFPVMKRFPEVPWIYSSWGSDLYWFQNNEADRANIERVLPHIDYLFTDNKRDFGIAKNLGFKGRFLGAFPGGGGFQIEMLQKYIEPVANRTVILIKGYQGRSGRAIQVLQAIATLQGKLSGYRIVIFGADEEVKTFLKNNSGGAKIDVFGRMSHHEVLELMGQALIYIGNSNSDGMPNTLLESILMGAFPIQSNPGGVTEEIITDQVNGLLIHDPYDLTEIATHIENAISNKTMLNDAFVYNQNVKKSLAYDTIKTEVLSCYQEIERAL